MTFLNLKYGQDLENQAAHPYQKFPGVTPEYEAVLFARATLVVEAR